MSIKRHGGERFQGKKQVDPFTELIKGKDAKVDDVQIEHWEQKIAHEKAIAQVDPTKRICSLCGKEFVGMGHNPEPLKPYEERCCDHCNEYRVIPARMRRVQEEAPLKQSGSGGTPFIDTREIAKKSPALAIAKEMMSGKFTGSVQQGTVPDRAVALQFYHALLAATIDGAAKIVLAANHTGFEYPQCINVGSIIHSAIHEINDRLAASGAAPLTEKETRQFNQLVNEEVSRTFFGLLREARLFQFRERDYKHLYKMAQVHTANAAGYEWTAPDRDTVEVPFEERKAVGEYTCKEGVLVPFPEKTPFDSCYFAWGQGIKPSKIQCRLWGFDPDAQNLLLATLISSDGWVFSLALRGTEKAPWSVGQKIEMEPTVILERIGNRGGEQFKFNVSRVGKQPDDHNIDIMNPGWTLPFGLVPWVVAYTITLIQRYGSLTKVSPHTFKERLLFKTLTKRTGHKYLPPPYYPVIIQPSVYEEFEKKIESQAREWSHRWDVIGHYAYKVARGTLPLDPKHVYKLTKRRYEIFHALHRPSAEVLTILTMRRVMPPREGEWVALLKSYKKAYIKGPKDKPYIPSLHRLKGGVPEVV